jgi:hypothetical protein
MHRFRSRSAPNCDLLTGQALAKRDTYTPLTAAYNENGMSNRLRRVVFGTALLAMTSGGVAVAATPAFRILYHEKIVLRKSAGAGPAERVTFDAYGRRFDLLLQPNLRIKRALPKSGGSVEPLQGTLEDTPGSWARITRSSTGWRGVFSDGQEIYAIEPAADVADAVIQPLQTQPSEPVVYRLSDALLPDVDGFCDTPLPPVADEEPPTALKAFQTLAAELQQSAVLPDRQIRIGVVADYEFVQAFDFGVTPEEAIVARMNVVDGIFSSQVGLKIELAPPTLFRQNNDPFTRFSADNLLDELRHYRRDTPGQLALGLTHLMTGRNLNGDTVGIAYLGAICGGGASSSLSEGARSTTTAALIAAHEIGHNFNAPHDGQRNAACASTPQSFLMAPRLNGSNTFSACSIAQIQPTVNNASCLTPYVPPDASIFFSGGAQSATVDTPFTSTISVSAMGDENSGDVVATVTLPTGITVQTATASDGTCTTGAGTVTCTLGTLASGESRTLSLGLIASVAGSLTATFTLQSSNDSIPTNNSGSVTYTVASAPPVIPPTQGSTGGGSSGGGGGRLDLMLLALLGAALAGTRFGRHKTIS